MFFCDMVVDNVEWIGSDGGRYKQDTLTYQYQQPFEKCHHDLLEIIEPSNFICHDSVIHRMTNIDWPVDVTHTPVDLRYWLKLFEKGFTI